MEQSKQFIDLMTTDDKWIWLNPNLIAGISEGEKDGSIVYANSQEFKVKHSMNTLRSKLKEIAGFTFHS